MAQIVTSDSKAPLREVREVQFGILDPDEIVSSSMPGGTEEIGGWNVLNKRIIFVPSDEVEFTAWFITMKMYTWLWSVLH